MRLKLSEETIKRLPAPAKGNKVHYFAGDVLQGAAVPKAKPLQDRSVKSPIV
jgi:hypothetical protein